MWHQWLSRWPGPAGSASESFGPSWRGTKKHWGWEEKRHGFLNNYMGRNCMAVGMALYTPCTNGTEMFLDPFLSKSSM